jgi:predicted permease
MTNLRDALRALRSNPLATSVAILSLALGIGANTAMFSIVDALVLRSLPVRNADRLVLLSASHEKDCACWWSNPVWESIRDRPTLFDGAFAYEAERFSLAQGGEIDPVDGLWASGRMFDVLGVDPILGRLFNEADDRRGGGPDGAVAVISYGFWQRKFGSASDVIGRTITLNLTPYTIVGVTPRTFFGPEVGRQFEVAVPLGTEPLMKLKLSSLDIRTNWWLHVVARLAPGQSVAQATAALRAVQPRIADETRPTNQRPQDAAMHLKAPFILERAASGTSDLRRAYEGPLFALMAVVGLTLLIACGNIANLLLARAAARRHELSVRTALGASSWRIARQLFTESLLLSAIGAAFGVAFAFWGSRVVVAQISTGATRVFLETGIDLWMLAFTAAVATATALLFGVVPALRASRVAPIEAMKEQGRNTSSGRLVGLAGSLVMAQVALSFVLLIGAGLFIRSFSSLASVRLGFDHEGSLAVQIGARRAGLDSAARGAMYEGILQAARAMPEVSQAALSVHTPVDGSQDNWPMEFPGRIDLTERQKSVQMNWVSPGWFAIMRTPLVAGRDFDDRDRLGAARTLIVNHAFAKKYFGTANPIGQMITEREDITTDHSPLQIVGVVDDVVYSSLREPPPPTMYWPIAQVRAPRASMTLIVRGRGSPGASLTKGIEAAIVNINHDLTLSFRPLTQQVESSIMVERLLAKLSGFFGALALLLAMLGLYGITSYAVNRRQVELGIRMALGTSPGGVVRLILSRMALLVGGGLVIGALASWWVSTFVSSMLFGLAPRDPSTMVGAMLVLVAVGAVAGWLPARRAARLDPARVLREG